MIRINFFILTILVVTLFIGGCGVTQTSSGSNNNQNNNNITGNGAYYTGIYASAASLTGSAYSQTQADQKISEAWQHFKDQLLTGEGNGAVHRTDVDGTVVSEGQSYGMMLAVQNNDQATFDKIWYWTNKYMQIPQPLGLFCWNTQINGTIIDSDSATDAEEMIALALIFASNLWGDKSPPYNYSYQAEQILNRMITNEVTSDNFLYAAPSSPTLFNPSYFMPAFYKVFNNFTNDSHWREIATNSYLIINRCLKISYGNLDNGLVPDWCDRSGNRGPQSMSGDFTYDAMRVPWHIALDKVWFDENDLPTNYLDKIIINFFAPIYQTFGDSYELNGNQLSPYHETSFIASFAGGAMGCSSQEAKVNFFNHLMQRPFATDQYRYYDICWHNLGLLLSAGKFRIYK